MFSPANKTPTKSPTSQTQDPPDLQDQDPPDLTQNPPDYQPPTFTDRIQKDEKMVVKLNEEKQLAKLERAEWIDEYLSKSKDPRDIEFIKRVEIKLLQEQNPSKTPQETTSSDPQDPINTKLFPTVVTDIPPEVKSASKPAATDAINKTTTSTGKSSTDPPKEPATSGSNNPIGNGGQPNPPSGGNDGENNAPPSPPDQGGNSWSGGGGGPPAPSSSLNHTKPPPNGPIMGGWKWLGTYHEPWTGGRNLCPASEL